MRHVKGAIPSDAELRYRFNRYPELKESEKYLKSLTLAVSVFLKTLEGVMHMPTSPERGRRVAELANALDMENDLARHFGLGIDLKTGKKPRKKAVES